MTRFTGLGAALAISAVLASPGHSGASTPAASAAREEAPSTKAAASESTPAVDAMGSLDACDAALTKANAGTLDKKEANLLHAAIGAAIRSDATCAPRVKRWLATNACTQTHGVVSSAAFGTNEWPAAWTTELVDRALDRDAAGEGSCIEATLPSVEQSVHVDPALAESLTRATKHADRDTRDAGWLLLGTVERRARASGNAGLASSLDARIAKELHRRMTAKAEDAEVLLESAGNAGCVACVPDVERALGAKDEVTRRIAAGALRFVDEPGTTARTCTVLRGDENAKVRSHAAWSLGWSHVDLETRAACLREAAESDASDAVRTDATRALEQLMDETKAMEDEGV